MKSRRRVVVLLLLCTATILMLLAVFSWPLLKAGHPVFAQHADALLSVSGACVVAVAVLGLGESPKRLRDHCERCGYNLMGNTSGVCPECGTAKAVDEEGGGCEVTGICEVELRRWDAPAQGVSSRACKLSALRSGHCNLF